jgi:hypothetical protein
MEQMEYRMEEISLGGHGSYAEQIVARLNELGRDGWRVTGIDLAGHPSWASRTVPVLLQRVAVAAAPVSRQQAAAGAR